MSETRPAPASQRRQLTVAAALVAALAATLGVLYLVYWLAAGRPLLAGPHDHDFGTIELGDSPVRLEHAFVLRNRTGRAVQIQDFRTSCTCTEASVSTRSIEPGGEVQVKAAIRMTNDGRKTATVTLFCDDDRKEILHLAAAARLKRRLDVPAAEAPLAPGETLTRAIHFSEYDSDEAPPAPQVSSPDGVTVALSDWTLVQRRQAAQMRPALWRAQMRITQDGAGAVPPGSLIRVRVGPDQQFELPIVPVVKVAAPPAPEIPEGQPEAPPWAPRESPAGSSAGGP